MNWLGKKSEQILGALNAAVGVVSLISSLNQLLLDLSNTALWEHHRLCVQSTST
jgi:hypothetical protein